jgi:hypothetical protein
MELQKIVSEINKLLSKNNGKQYIRKDNYVFTLHSEISAISVELNKVQMCVLSYDFSLTQKWVHVRIYSSVPFFSDNKTVFCVYSLKNFLKYFQIEVPKSLIEYC